MNRVFKHPSGHKFSIPEEWILEAGIENFVPNAHCYESAVSAITIIPLAQIGPPSMRDRQHLGHGGFDRGRLIRVLREILNGDQIWPVEVMKWEHDGFDYILTAGVHRFHASIVVGFTHIPTVKGWIFEDMRPPQNST
jgi:hypothetical protein